jgi:putative component of membrane protein insertase Oxa1/YidC/SpoIIIJ protein YidD
MYKLYMPVLGKAGFLIFCFFLSNQAFSQQSSQPINAVLIHQTFDTYHYHKTPGRGLLSLKNKTLIGKLNPVTYLSAGMLFFYQRIISEQLQADCTYETSCSEFTKLGLQNHGLKGFLLGIDQWSNCIPSVIDDLPRHRISPNYKIINRFEE